MRKESPPDAEKSLAPTPWEKERDKLRTLWVVAVLVFWGTVAFQVVLYFVEDGRVNFVLLSIIAGMMILGVVLKVKYQRHLQKKNG